MLFINQPDGGMEIRFQDEAEEKRMLDILMPHGKWIETDVEDEIYGSLEKCTNCGEAILSTHMSYCGNCGAKMEVE